MLQRTWSSIALLLAVGCQSAPTSLEPSTGWQGAVDAPYDGMRSEMAELRSLLIELTMPQVGDQDGTAVAPIDAAAGVGVAAELVALQGRVDRLGVMLSAGGGAQPIHAALRAANPPAAQEAGAIESLQAALIVLEVEHAVHSENIANCGVVGHKRRHVVQGSMVDQSSGASIPIVIRTHQNMEQGALESTGDQLDLAIQGPGYFEIQRPNGDLTYTRAGSFRMDFNGRLVTGEGYLLTDQVVVPEGSGSRFVSISPDGQVFGVTDDSHQTQIGTIRVHCFANPGALKAISFSHFVPTASSGEPCARHPGVDGAGKVKQGYLERSNVHLIDEVAELRVTQRQAAAVKLALASHGIYSL